MTSHPEEFLIITPPVLVPTQVPVGAFILAAYLTAVDRSAILYDASIEFFHYVLTNASISTEAIAAENRRKAHQAVHYFQKHRYYRPQVHRSHINNLHRFFSKWSAQFRGWQVGLTDVSFSSIPPHAPEQFRQYLEKGGVTPFTEYIHARLIPTLQATGMKNIGVSLTYLSQIYFAVELGVILKQIGIKPFLGGALVRVIEKKLGRYFDFNRLYQRSETADPVLNTVLKHDALAVDGPLKMPELMVPLNQYLTPVPLIPFPLSRGCYWDKCLFCPDANQGFRAYETEHLTQFLTSIVAQNLGEVIFNISDAAIPLARLNRLLPFFTETRSQFYGFFRFEPILLKPEYLNKLHAGGARLLQFGLESGSQKILDLYCKGIDLVQAEKVLHFAHQAGLKNYVYLLFGLPLEEERDRELTREFIRKNHQAIDFLNLAIFNLPVDCEIAKAPARFEITLTTQKKYQTPLQFYVPFTSKTGPVRVAARQFIQQRFKRDPLIRAIILNSPARLRIDHAIFFE